MTVRFAGQTMDEQYALGLISIKVFQQLSVPTLCDLVFSDQQNKFGNFDTISIDTPVSISADGHETVLFEGSVTAIAFNYDADGVKEVRIRAYDALHVLRNAQRLETHVQMTPAELFSRLVGDVGLTVDATESGPLLERMMQFNESDLTFIVNMTRRYALYFFLCGTSVKLFRLTDIDDIFPLKYGKELLEVTVELNSTLSCRTVDSSGWNPLNGELYDAYSQHKDEKNRAEASEKLSALVKNRKRYDVGRNVQNSEQLDANARASLDHDYASELIVSGTAEGNTALRPGVSIELSGVANSLSGQYQLTSVSHVIDRFSGYVTELSSSPPKSINTPSSDNLVVLSAVVTSVDDPKNCGRIQAVIPTLGELETNWMQVVCAGAGQNKGLVILPDIDDQIIILFNHADPCQAIVLGGVYGLDGPPESGVKGGRVERYSLTTPGGQKIQLNDDGSTIRLQNNDGSYVQLSDEKVKLFSARDLDISAPGNKITIKAAEIDFEQA